MNTLAKIWDHPKVVNAELPLGEQPEASSIVAERTLLTSPQEVRACIEAFGGRGWVMFTGQVDELLGDGAALKPGIVVASEQVAGDRSLHIRQSAAGWTAWELERGTATDQWIFKETYQRIPRGTLTYEVAWEKSEDGVFRPVVCRLADIHFG